jgi:hypothetical protein
MTSQSKNKATILYKYGICFIVVLFIVLMGFVFVKLTHNRLRMSAYKHLRRNQRTCALLDRSVKPNAVLKSFPQTQTVFGTIEPRPRWIREIDGVKLVVGRLSGPDADDSDLYALSRFHELEYLELVNAGISESALNKLREAVPDCQIVNITTEPNASGHAVTQRP